MTPPLPQSVLLVDGYNIIGAWSSLKRTRDKAGLETARSELIEVIISYSAYMGYETQVVFDAHYQNTCSSKEIITELVTTYYTDFGQTADSYIEKLCASLRPSLAQSIISRIIVATSDRTQQLMVQGYGAEWISAQQFCCEVENTVCRTQQKSKQNKKSNGRFLANSIDAKARARLAEMRLGLK